MMVSSLSRMIAAMLLQLCLCRDPNHSLDSLSVGIRRNVNLIAIHRNSIVIAKKFVTLLLMAKNFVIEFSISL